MDQENVSVYQKIATILPNTLTTTHVNAYISAKIVLEIYKILIRVSGTMFMENVCVFQTQIRILMDVMTSRLPLTAKN